MNYKKVGGKKRNQRKEEKMGIVLRGKTDVVKTVLTWNTLIFLFYFLF